MRIWDGFTFYNELDLLEVRLRELSDVVHRFVLVESPITHQGRPKPLFFQEHRHRFEPWLGQIIHLVADLDPTTDDPWVRERGQRAAILDGLGAADPSDLVVISDVDEIPRASSLRALAESDTEVAALEMDLYYHRFNLRYPGHWYDAKWYQAKAGRRSALGDINELRLRSGLPVQPDAGWHMSYLGDAEHATTKITSFAHPEVADDGWGEPIHLRRAIRHGVSYLDGALLEVVSLDQLPASVADVAARSPGLVHPPRSAWDLVKAWGYANATRYRLRLGPERVDAHPVLSSAVASAAASVAPLARAVRRSARRLRA